MNKKDMGSIFLAVLVCIIVIWSVAIPVMSEGVHKAVKHKCHDHFNTTDYQMQGVADGPWTCCYQGECYEPEIEVYG